MTEVTGACISLFDKLLNMLTDNGVTNYVKISPKTVKLDSHSQKNRSIFTETSWHFWAHYNIYRVAHKVNHYQESSLNRIKTASAATFPISFEYKMSRRTL